MLNNSLNMLIIRWNVIRWNVIRWNGRNPFETLFCFRESLVLFNWITNFSIHMGFDGKGSDCSQFNTILYSFISLLSFSIVWSVSESTAESGWSERKRWRDEESGRHISAITQNPVALHSESPDAFFVAFNNWKNQTFIYSLHRSNWLTICSEESFGTQSVREDREERIERRRDGQHW